MVHDPGATDKLEKLAQARSVGPVREIFRYLLDNKKWWLIPIVVVLLVVAALVAISATPLAPFIYPLF